MKNKNNYHAKLYGREEIEVRPLGPPSDMLMYIDFKYSETKYIDKSEDFDGFDEPEDFDRFEKWVDE